MTTATKPVCLLKLYIAGDNAVSRKALANLRSLGAGRLGGLCKVEVVDVMARPDVALRDNIWAVPTLVRVLPEPVREIAGDLSDLDDVLRALDFARSA